MRIRCCSHFLALRLARMIPVCKSAEFEPCCLLDELFRRGDDDRIRAVFQMQPVKPWILLTCTNRAIRRPRKVSISWRAVSLSTSALESSSKVVSRRVRMVARIPPMFRVEVVEGAPESEAGKDVGIVPPCEAHAAGQGHFFFRVGFVAFTCASPDGGKVPVPGA